MTTTQDIYAAIAPLPAKLSEKGKAEPTVAVTMEANVGQLSIAIGWKKPHSGNNWEREYKYFSGASFEEAFTKAVDHIAKMPSAEEAKLQDFMKRLGKVIDVGKDYGVSIDYLNPLLDSMKRLSENAITYAPEDDDVPF